MEPRSPGSRTLRGAIVLAGLALAGCADTRPTAPPPPPPPPPPLAPSAAASSVAWPELPRTQAAASELVRARTTRDRAGVGDAELGPEALLDALARRPGALVAGEDRITRWIQAFLDRAAGRDAYVIVGAYHDAGGQVDAFRRLIGPLGLRGLTVASAEQLRATGAWGGVPTGAQQGDSAEIAAWIERGDRGALDALGRRHRETDYAAWKFGYEAGVLDLLATARAAAVPFAGCDMPAETQALLGAVDEDARLRLRELHCLLALPPARGPRRAALLWGQAHARAPGFRRFLPPDAAALALYVFGYRAGEWTTETRLAAKLALAEPLLIPLDDAGAEAALLYPDGPLAAEVDRVREDAPGPAGLRVRLEGAGKGTLTVGDRAFPVGPDWQRVEVPAGDAAWVLEAGGARLAGALRVPPGGGLDLRLDPARRAIGWTERAR